MSKLVPVNLRLKPETLALVRTYAETTGQTMTDVWVAAVEHYCQKFLPTDLEKREKAVAAAVEQMPAEMVEAFDRARRRLSKVGHGRKVQSMSSRK